MIRFSYSLSRWHTDMSNIPRFLRYNVLLHANHREVQRQQVGENQCLECHIQKQDQEAGFAEEMEHVEES